MKLSRAGALAIAATFWVTAGADAYQQSVQTGLALEIVYLKGQPPVLSPEVSVPPAEPSGGWFSRFGRVEISPPSDNKLPVKAVQILSHFEGKLVKVRVTVLLGRDLHERAEQVTIREIGEGEKVIINELARFGVDPFEIKVVKVKPHITILPGIVNKIKSITVAGIRPEISTIPSYQLSFLNNSNKDIVVLEWHVTARGRTEVSSRPHGLEGRPLILAHSQQDFSISAAYQIRPEYGGSPPDFTRDHYCVIDAAVFSDGSYEGDAETAATIKAMLGGRKRQLSGVVTLWKSSLASLEPDANVILQSLITDLSALKTDLDVAEIKALRMGFHDLASDPRVQAKLINAFRAALQWTKTLAINDLRSFQTDQGSALNMPALQAWLQKTGQKYEGWLSRM